MKHYISLSFCQKKKWSFLHSFATLNTLPLNDEQLMDVYTKPTTPFVLHIFIFLYTENSSKSVFRNALKWLAFILVLKAPLQASETAIIVKQF